jgi:Protein of unknown function (DUF2630)
MDDDAIHERIERLVAEEHELWTRESSGDGHPGDARRLEHLKVSLDQSWDLLRQRRALRDARHNPDEAHVREPDVVENYEG